MIIWAQVGLTSDTETFVEPKPTHLDKVHVYYYESGEHFPLSL